MNSEMKKQSGFTLIELMIVVAIVAILAAIALPAYQTYTKKARFTEVVAASGAAKTAIDICSQSGGTPDSCVTTAESAVSGTVATDNVEKVEIETAGSAGTATFTITATGKSPVDSKTYVLKGTEENGRVKWETNPSGSVGTCVDAGFCN